MSENVLHWIELIALWQPLVSAVSFAWGAGDPTWLLWTKRLFLLPPIGAIALAYWATVLSIPTILVRTRRRTFFSLVIVTWWDLARATFTFWGGQLRFVLRLLITLFGFGQVLVLGVWTLIKELFLVPFRVVRNASSNVLTAGVPWIAVFMTVFWCVFEAVLFTFVMTSLVIDTLSNIAGIQLTEAGVRIPLFLFMLFIALGSYAVLAQFTDALKSRDWATIIKIGVVEFVALFVEIVFLYREFVDALVPWFAQHTSGKFELGIAGTLLISAFVWLGIRSLSWFLFAAAGTPTILSIISGQGVSSPDGGSAQPREFKLFSDNFKTELRNEFTWVTEEGQRLLDAFLVPPMNMVAAALNFVTLLTSNKHLLELPLESIQDFKDSRTLAAELVEGANEEAA